MYVWTREGLGQEPRLPILPSSSAAEVQQIHNALGKGLRDENGLTNMVFFARHPERQRRKLMPGEPHLEQLRGEWLDIRDRLVRPAMKMASVTGRSPVVSKTAVVNVPQATRSVPGLIAREGLPLLYTLYVRIPLGPESPAQPMTGIFVCSNYRPQPQVDLILYLHGHKAGHMPLSVSIDQYWKMRQFGLREELNASMKNVILVAPTMGPRSEPGALIARDGLDTYLNQVLSALKEYGPYRSAVSPPTVGNIILASHSGGGSAMLSLATSRQQYTPRIRECWGFDCLYGDVERAWATWARSRPGAKLYVSYLNSTAERSQRLMRERLPNVFVARSTAQDHDHVPITHWRERIRGSPLLQDT